MKYLPGVTAALTAFAILAAGTLSAQEKKIQRSDLPPAVEATVVAQSTGATVKGVSEEVEGGKTLYEVEMTVNGHSKNLVIDATGTLIEIEEETLFEVLPARIKDGILRAGGKDGRVIKAETITRAGEINRYEAQIDRKGKTFEVVVGPTGKPIKGEKD